MTAVEELRGGNDSGDERDPHDLSLSPKHAARTSIVDNMLLSLDQFAPGSSVLDDYRLFNSVLGSDMYSRISQDSPGQSRYRGNTFSSSLSSDTELGHEAGTGLYGSQFSRGRRSNSSSNYQPGLGRIGNGRNWEGQRYPATGKGSKSSGSSNVDFGHTFSKDRRGSGSESCSASFDYGPRRAFAPFAETSDDYDELSYDETDAAPTPSVPAGPRKHQAPNNDYTGALNHQPSRTPVASRRNSMKSAHSSHPKKARPENIGTATIRSRDNDFKDFGETDLDPPPAIPASLDPPAPSPTISFNKPAFPPPEPTPSKERPGFFRRVFGSSKNSSPGPSEQGQSETPSLQESESSLNLRSRKQPHKNTTAGTAASTREGPPQVVNKKSSFFRRRKKSVVDSVPPPLVIPQEFGPRLVDLKAEPSPVSSLRQVMNPFLADVSSSALHDSKENAKSETDANKEGDQSLARIQKQKRSSARATSSGSRPRHGRDPPAAHSSAHDSNFAYGTEGHAAKYNQLDHGSFADMQQGHHSSEYRQAPIRGGASSNDSIEKPPSCTLQNEGAQHPVASAALPPVAEDLSPRNESPAETPRAGPLLGKNGPEESSDFAPSQYCPDGSSKLSPTEGPNASPAASTSEISNYYTASNTPVIPSEEPISSEATESKADVPVNGPTDTDREQAQKLFDSQDQVVGNEPAAAWLGDIDRAMVRQAYMRLFDWTSMNILAALRSMCTRLVLKGETQQVDRVLDAFSTRWCECNSHHGFKSAGMLSPGLRVTALTHARCCPYYLLLIASTKHRPPPCGY